MKNQKVSTMSKLNYLKKVALFLLAIVMMLSVNVTTVEAKAKTKLNTTSVELTVGKTKTLKLKNYNKKKVKKAKWSTSNKKVVSIKASKQKCTITAKKAGKATVKVKYNGKTYKCKVVVKKKHSTTTTPTTQPTTEQTTTEKTTEKTTTETTTETTTTTPGTTETSTVPTTPNTAEHDCLSNSEYTISVNEVVITCSVCGKVITDTDESKSYKEVWETTPATCTTDGYQVKYKVYDDGTKEMMPNTKKVLPATGHTEVSTYTYKDDAGNIHKECICSHLKIYRTTKCSTCNTTLEDNINVLNTKDPNKDPYTVYIDLNPNNYDTEWQAGGSYGACVMEVRCNQCDHLLSYNDHFTTDIVYSQALSYKDKGYTLILRSNTLQYESDCINAIKKLCGLN